MTGYTRHEAEPLAALVHAVRPTWDVAGILAALAKIRDRDIAVTSYAALRAAAIDSNRTPAVIAMDGPHWRPPTAGQLPTPRPPSRCDRCGSFARDAEGACIDCQLGETPASDDNRRRHIAAARAALATRPEAEAS